MKYRLGTLTAPAALGRIRAGRTVSLVATAAIVIAISGFTGCLPAKAQSISITPVYQFTARKASGVNTDGAYPTQGMTQTSDGTIYGTCYSGGAYRLGTLFEITPDGNFVTLHSFKGPDGIHPSSGAIDGFDGKVYGTTAKGGSPGFGVIFKLHPSGVFDTLHRFHGATDGAYPIGGLAQAFDYRFYGTTSAGGANGFGTVYNIDEDGKLTTLYDFTGGADGGNPTETLTVVPTGNGHGLPLLAGVTEHGGLLSGSAPGDGTIFTVSPPIPNSGDPATFNTVYTFTGGSDGGEPNSQLVVTTSGNIYGTTSTGGLYGYGTIFQLTPAGALTVIANLTSPNTFGGQATNVLASDGSLLTVASDTTKGWPGELIRTTTGGAYAELTKLDGGADSLIQESDGSFLGLLAYGGANGTGELFKLTDSDIPPKFSLTSLLPRSCYEGAPGFTLTVDGTQFNSDAVVLWNGQPLPTTYVSPSQLKATVAASLVTKVQSPNVSVDNGDDAVANSLAFYVTVTYLDLAVGTGSRDSNDNIVFPIELVNSGNNTAYDFTFTTVKLGQVVTTSALPAPLNVPAHSTVTVDFTFPPKAATAGSTETVKVFAHYTGRALWEGFVPVTVP